MRWRYCTVEAKAYRQIQSHGLSATAKLLVFSSKIEHKPGT